MKTNMPDMVLCVLCMAWQTFFNMYKMGCSRTANTPKDKVKAHLLIIYEKSLIYLLYPSIFFIFH